MNHLLHAKIIANHLVKKNTISRKRKLKNYNFINNILELYMYIYFFESLALEKVIVSEKIQVFKVTHP